uniref:Uncharacterized protein n=1 Tax=Arundo donax TaxID=35708 RepID=A0A0A9FR29_ARUDO
MRIFKMDYIYFPNLIHMRYTVGRYFVVFSTIAGISALLYKV